MVGDPNNGKETNNKLSVKIQLCKSQTTATPKKK